MIFLSLNRKERFYVDMLLERVDIGTGSKPPVAQAKEGLREGGR
jgi:hypothetical protein